MAKQKEIYEEMGILGVVKTIETKRDDGTIRVQFDYTNCPTLTDQHSAHLTDINYLIEKHSPDELALYLESRNQYRQEILGHDFSKEPSLQDGLNQIADLRRTLDSMPEEIKMYCRTPLDFVKFVDNPKNQEILIRHGLITKKEIATITQTTTTSASEKAEATAKAQSSDSKKSESTNKT